MGNKHLRELIVKYLSKEIETKENNMLDKKINDDEQSRKVFDDYIEVWEKSADVSDFDRIDPVKDWQIVKSRIKFRKGSKKIPVRVYFTRIAAIMLLAVGLAYFFSLIVNKTEVATDDEYFETVSYNNTETVLLPDNSKIILNKNSRLIRNSNYGITNRDIILQGEAFFDVTKNKDLPFKVYAVNSTIEVLGTSFNVKTDSVNVIVGVISGKVSFYQSENTKNKIELLPENTGLYNSASHNFSHQMNKPDMLTWYTGEFRFNNTPFSEVCSVIAEYYNLELSENFGTLIEKPLDGKYIASSAEETVTEINSITTDIDLIIINNMLTVEER